MIRVGICGYGNLGRGVEASICQNDDMELVAVFTRRDPSSLEIHTKNVSVYSMERIEEFRDKIDVMILCGGSRTDLPIQTPTLAKMFNVVDSFDTHATIYEHYNNVNNKVLESKHTALISTGWDPGMFSIARCYASAILPNSSNYTFWGRGVSQGHSDAIRRIDGVVDARQYTIPKDEALEKVRSGENPNLMTRDKHLRECFVVVKQDADKTRIEKEIKEMPNYFSDYETIVNFISLDELKKNHSKMPHGGFVINTGTTGFDNENKHSIEYSLKLDSNPEFTGSVLVCYARAVVRLYKEGNYGCKTPLDIAPIYLINKTKEELLKHMI